MREMNLKRMIGIVVLLLVFSMLFGCGTSVQHVNSGSVSSKTLSEKDHVELHINKKTVPLQGSLTLKVINHGKSGVFLGSAYQIEKHTNGVWRNIPMQEGFNSIQMQLGTGKSYVQAIHLKKIKNLTKGEYRVSKTIHTTQKKQIKLYLTFNVK